MKTVLENTSKKHARSHRGLIKAGWNSRRTYRTSVQIIRERTPPTPCHSATHTRHRHASSHAPGKLPLCQPSSRTCVNSFIATIPICTHRLPSVCARQPPASPSGTHPHFIRISGLPATESCDWQVEVVAACLSCSSGPIFAAPLANSLWTLCSISHIQVVR